MPQELVKGWLESQSAFEARRAEQVKKDAEGFEASLKDGTAGRVVNDRADQIAVVKYRQEQAKLRKEREEQVAVLNARREMAKEFQRHQELDAKTQPKFGPEKMSAVQERLSMWQPKRFRSVDAETQTLEDTRSLRSK